MPPTDKYGEAISTVARLRTALVKHITDGNPLAREMQQWRNDLCDVEDSLRAAAPSADRAQEPTKEQRQAISDLLVTMRDKMARGDEINWLAMPHEIWRALRDGGGYVPIATPSSALPQEDRTRIADANLNALLTYTGGFYSVAMEHGMKRGETANAIAHVESAARALHRLAIKPESATSPTISAEQLRAVRAALEYKNPRKQGQSVADTNYEMWRNADDAIDNAKDAIDRILGDIESATDSAGVTK